jgi:hypothetical protein
MMRSIMLALLAAAAAGLSACAGSGGSLYHRLQDEDPKVRVEAAIEAGQAHDAKAMVLLIERLDDSEVDVRFYSIGALERITGQTFGYKCYEPIEARRQAIERWRQYAAKSAKQPKTHGEDTGKMPVKHMGETRTGRLPMPQPMTRPAVPLTSAQRSAP